MRCEEEKNVETNRVLSVQVKDESAESIKVQSSECADSSVAE